MKAVKSPTLVLLRAAIFFCTATALLAAQGSPKIRIATGDPDPDPLSTEKWKEFSNYLNGHLKDACQIELVQSDQNQALIDLKQGKIQGAILAPFRYVVADLQIPNLMLVSRLRRDEVVSAVSSDQISESHPRENYRSLILIDSASKVLFPPAASSTPVEVSISDYRSTSEYVFPFAWFSDQQISEVAPVAERASVTNAQDAWQVPESSQPSATRLDAYYRDRFESVKEHKAAHPLLTVGADRFKLYESNAENRSAFHQIAEVGPIPFDAVVVRSDCVPNNAKDSEKVLDSIRKAFLSTRDMDELDRNRCFQWKQIQQPDATNSEPGQTQYWQRQPDIHDFVEARDEDYDGVREAAAKAFHGYVVHVAISRLVHRDNRDLDYLRTWMKEVLRQTVSKEPVFIKVEMLDSDFDVLLEELENGRLDAAELNAATAAKAVGRNTGALIGRALFYNANKPHDKDPRDSYSFVVLSAKGVPNDRDKLNPKLKFAYTVEDSSSGYQYPLAWLKKQGKSPSRSSLVKGNKATEVVQLLLNKAEKPSNHIEKRSIRYADYGFLSSFEWDEIKEEWNNPGLGDLKQVVLDPKETAIPNAYLVFSRTCVPGINSQGLPCPTPHEEVLLSSTTNSPSVLPTLASTVVDSVRTNLPDKGNVQGFDGYEQTGEGDINELAKSYNNPVRAGVAMLITLIVLLAAGVAISFKRRGQAPQTELSIQSLFDVLKGVSPKDRGAKQAVTLGVKELSALNNATPLFEKILGEPALRELQTNLKASLLEVLTFHDTNRASVPDGRYTQALANLQSVTATADNQFREVEKAFTGWSKPQQEELAGNMTTINSVIELANRLLTIMK